MKPTAFPRSAAGAMAAAPPMMRTNLPSVRSGSLDGWFGEVRFASFHSEPIVQSVPGDADAGRRRFTMVMLEIFADERSRYAEHHVASEAFVAIDEYLRDQRLVPGLEA